MAGIVVLTLVASIYLLTAARDIVLGDNPELITVALTLGVAHAPGYPLLTMAAHPFSLMPFGTEPFRLNLFSVCCGVATAGMTYQVSRHLTGGLVGPAAAVLLLAFNPIVWTWSLVLEAFPLNNLLAATLIFCLVVWHQRPGRMEWFVAAAFIGGLGVSNHHTIVLLGPAVLWMMWCHRAELLGRPAVIPIAITAFFLGLLPYLYIPWAASHHPAMNWGDVSTLGDFISVFTRADYGSVQLRPWASMETDSLGDRLLALGSSFSVPEAVLILLGAFKAYKNHRTYFWFTLLAFLISGPAFSAYANAYPSSPVELWVLERFFLLPHVIVAPLVAFGVWMWADLLARSLVRHRPHLAVPVVASCVAIATLGAIISNYARVDQSQNTTARLYAEDILASLLPNSLLLVEGDAQIFPLAYLQLVEGRRPDVTLVWTGLLDGPWYLPGLQRQHPDLAIPFDRYDSKDPSRDIGALARANPARFIGVVGGFPEDSLQESHHLVVHGLVLAVEPAAVAPDLYQLGQQNRDLYELYRPPVVSRTPKGAEYLVLAAYIRPALRLAELYERNQQLPEAELWYKKVLDIYPGFVPARLGLARVSAATG